MAGKELLGYLSAFFVVVSFGPYIWSILKGQTKPHLFTWIVWSLIYTIVAAAQHSVGAGPGVWATAAGCLFCFIVAILSVRWGERDITTSDWIAFIGSLAALPLWYATKNALWSVIVVTVIESVGFYPTFRKSWIKPHEELIYQWAMEAIRFTMALFAMEQYSLTAVLTPLFVVVSNSALILMLLWRRYRLRDNRVVGK